jgi:cellulose synthase/poly-beta-1,6-N-acetylglucosamine synthase-like glycosyltransferase
MDYLKVLSIFNNSPAPEPKPAPVVKPKTAPVVPTKPESDVTFVLTTDGRFDLLEKTLDSFLKYNDYPIDKFIIIDDSADPVAHEAYKKLNTKYGNKFEFIFNETKLKQMASIDKAYAKVTTKYIFHCEDDWEFYRSGFIGKSKAILEGDENILQAWIRPKSDGILNKIDTNIININGIQCRKVLPVSFVVPGAGPRGTDLIVKDYMGFSFNPGLKRLSDYKALNRPLALIKEEHLIDITYRTKMPKSYVVSLSTTDDYGFVKHIGQERIQQRAAENMAKKQKEKELQEAKQKELQAKQVSEQQATFLMPKFSVVMQTFLGDYPGSRTNPIQKFHRAVASFLAQTYSNAELIIVSDGCDLTRDEYMKAYKSNPKVKFVYVDKEGPNMYDQVNGKKFYRGVPRKMGVSLATGDYITYMDSDDVLLPNFLATILIELNKKPNLKWLINKAWYDHINVISEEGQKKIVTGTVIMPYEKVAYNIPNIEGPFLKTQVAEGYVVMTPWLFTHTADCKSKWEDVTGDVSEDVVFNRKIREEFPNMGWSYNQPQYVRCHYTDLWDV